jgi:lysylphosphatidylglycerol synthetase-like protein (DUF2156 family)
MQGFLFIESLQIILAMRFLSRQKVRLTRKGNSPLLVLLSLLPLPCLFLALFQLFLLIFDNLKFLSDFFEVVSVHPLFLPSLVGEVLSQSELIIVDALPQLISAQLVQFHS